MTEANENEFHDGMRTTEALFENIDGQQAITEIESLCMNCHENGITKLLLTKIPHFKELVIMAFECPHCGLKNNEIQPASSIQEKGIHQTCLVSTQEDLNRQVIKSERATIRFEELDFEIPPESQCGVLSTIDGIIDRAIEGLKQNQDLRLREDYDIFKKIEAVIEKLQSYYNNECSFTFVLDDPSGNSHIENLFAPNPDPKLTLRQYTRTAQQNEFLGLQEADLQDELPLNEQVHVFPGNCSQCNAPAETRMHMLDIPHFKEVIIMATDCTSCGYKNNEVKAGGAVSKLGKSIELKMEDMDDLNRDILKSESCSLMIPEINLELTTGTLGGRFTTVEGLLTQVKDELKGRSEFLTGDSAQKDQKDKFANFLNNLEKVINGELFPVTLILRDPLANSHLQNPYAPDPDPNMTITEFERTFEENEDFGLNDMDVESYENK